MCTVLYWLFSIMCHINYHINYSIHQSTKPDQIEINETWPIHFSYQGAGKRPGQWKKEEIYIVALFMIKISKKFNENFLSYG